ncbi:hypothetical protein VNO78_18147 [Psophocarpus tetragonolobus]|uniref:Uncharacterized protein n=1 Tax=Psophocarpus tetragonolobus TaxID=3891 RepID=A0AAN9SNX5_PSOTE
MGRVYPRMMRQTFRLGIPKDDGMDPPNWVGFRHQVSAAEYLLTPVEVVSRLYKHTRALAVVWYRGSAHR